jgi:capsular polysaccharide biosynthesis protein
LVLLPAPALAESTNSDIDTQVTIALSTAVLERAGQTAVPALPARSVEKMIKISAPTNQLIKIDATSAKAADAQTVSQAVADSYVGYVSNTAREVTAAALADLTVRRDQLLTQFRQLRAEIAASAKRQEALNPNSPDGLKEAQLLAELRTQQADISVQLDKVEDKIATGGPVPSSATAGTSVIQKATEASGHPTWLRLLFWGTLGALVCTFLAAIVLLVRARRDPRVRLRDEIADATGSPVLAAVRSRPQKSVAGWSTLLETYEATPTESWAFRQLLRALPSPNPNGDPRVSGKVAHPHSLTVASLSGDEQGVAIGPQLAAYASSLGVRTHLVTALGHESAATLWAACITEHEGVPRPGLYVGNVMDPTAIDLTIVLVVLDRKQPDLREAPTSAATILSVATGTATEHELARVAVAMDDAGRRIDGIVVADPDQTDHTSGRRTMDERAQRPTLPLRLTGMASSKRAASNHQRIVK